jgi:hypothetical protein
MQSEELRLTAISFKYPRPSSFMIVIGVTVICVSVGLLSTPYPKEDTGLQCCRSQANVNNKTEPFSCVEQGKPDRDMYSPVLPLVTASRITWLILGIMLLVVQLSLASRPNLWDELASVGGPYMLYFTVCIYMVGYLDLVIMLTLDKEYKCLTDVDPLRVMFSERFPVEYIFYETTTIVIFIPIMYSVAYYLTSKEHNKTLKTPSGAKGQLADV